MSTKRKLEKEAKGGSKSPKATKRNIMATMPELVGKFSVRLVEGVNVSRELTSSAKLLTSKKIPTVIHFYNSGWGGCRPCAAQMEKWARRYGRSQVQFLMACVDSERVAVEFGRMFDLRSVVNSWIPSREYFPVGFGQLGCSGFVVSDRNGYFASRKTDAYLQHGDRAFLHVEDILREDFGVEPARRAAAPAGESKEEDILSPDFVLPSVGVSSMDREHEECEEALSLLLRAPNVQTLRGAVRALEGHFLHEEGLMRSSGFGGDPGEPLSPYSGHAKDHERILDIGRVEIGRREGGDGASPSTKCAEVTEGPAWHRQAAAEVDRSVAEEIVREFRLHATRFDVLYSGRVRDDAGEEKLE